MDERTKLLELVEQFNWHHKFEIVPGVVTKGSYDPLYVLNRLRLPESMAGETVLDVGACNGFYSFELARKGAQVTALDFKHKNVSGFEIAQRLNGLAQIEHHQMNVLDLTEEFGTFDTVLFLGVIYHIADPYRALRNIRRVTRKRAFIESYCIDNNVALADGSTVSLATAAPDLGRAPLVQFMPDHRREKTYVHNDDPSNFWGFSSAALEMMVRDVGFKVVRTDVDADRVLIEATPESDPATSNRLQIAYGQLGSAKSKLSVV